MKERGFRPEAAERPLRVRARRVLRMLACAPVALSLACSARPAPKAEETGGSTSGKGVIPMAQLELNVTLKRPEVIAGESIPVAITLRNGGSRTVRVHSPQSRSPFVFQMLSAKDGTVVHTWSAAQHEWQLTGGDPLPPYTPPMTDLAPGKEITHENDMASYATEPILPGRYRVVVHYAYEEQQLSSRPAELTVAVPRPEAVAETADPGTDTLAAIFTHRWANGALSLFQRDSSPGRPDLGTFLRCLDRGPEAQIGGVALAVVAGEARGRRWYAWLEGDRVGAAFAAMKQRPGSLDYGPLALSDARLLPVGRKHDDGRAVFLVAGNDKGKARVKEITFTMDKAPAVRTLDPGSGAMPPRMLACYQAEGGDATVTLIWPEVDRDRVRIYRYAVPPGKGAGKGERKLLLERTGALLALEAPPLGGHADVLIGPAGGQNACTYLRLSLEDGNILAEHPVPLPAQKVDLWAIAAGPAEIFAALAKTGDLLFRYKAGDWSILTPGVREARHLRLHVLRGGRLWATWADPQAGFRYRRIE
jgi:hypothetical protein